MINSSWLYVSRSSMSRGATRPLLASVFICHDWWLIPPDSTISRPDRQDGPLHPSVFICLDWWLIPPDCISPGLACQQDQMGLYSRQYLYPRLVINSSWLYISSASARRSGPLRPSVFYMPWLMVNSFWLYISRASTSTRPDGPLLASVFICHDWWLIPPDCISPGPVIIDKMKHQQDEVDVDPRQFLYAMIDD